MMSRTERTVRRLLEMAGVTANGSKTHDPQIHDPRFYSRILDTGSLGLGESYMEHWWDVERLDELISRLAVARLHRRGCRSPKILLHSLSSKLANQQCQRRAFQVGEQHYDVGNDLYQGMLGQSMAYSCGYYGGGAQTLDQAQEAKLELICNKLELQPGMRVLDVGCGFGSFARHAARHYGVEVVGLTISREQLSLGEELCSELPVELRLQDYRELQNETFDRIVSIGMFEHVGVKNYQTYFEVVRRLLREDGLFLLQTVGGRRSWNNGDPWVEKYIFPNSMLPSIAQIGRAIEELFVAEDWHNFGADYEKTLLHWHRNFTDAWPSLKKHYDKRFRRMWEYYLLSFAGMFRVRKLQLWQIVLSPEGVRGGYRPIRYSENGLKPFMPAYDNGPPVPPEYSSAVTGESRPKE